MAAKGQDPDEPRVDETPDVSAPWFDPQVIQKGFLAGKASSHTPAIWIDSERGVFYYQYHD
jgi:hypothetical protein